MKKWILMCLLLSCTLACNTATTGGAKVQALKAGMPNTVALPDGKVVYNLNGEWETTLSSAAGTVNGIIKISQDGNRFVGVVAGGNLPFTTEKGEKVKGKVDGATLTDVNLYTWQGWAMSSAEIKDSGNTIVIETAISEASPTTVLKRK
jgi:uncharacterized protein YaiE (UPF0345 family)